MIVVYIIAGIPAALLVLSFVMPSKYMVEKTVIINTPAFTVINNVADLNQYSSWNPWQQMEPTAKATITGTPKTPGHKYAWIGKKIGEGSLTINSVDDQHVHIDLEFIKPWKARSKDNWHFEPWGDGNETKVTWQNSGELPWPMGRLMYPVINKNLNHQFDTGLANLKKVCEGS
jgi:hypothetical protein